MRIVSLLFGSLALSYAMSAPSSTYVDALKNFLSSKKFTINGLFYMYDFDHNGIDPNDWIYITNDDQHNAFRLLGKTPTDANAFGWLPLNSIPSDLEITKPTGYFIFINFPQDQTYFHTNSFSWIYVSQGKVYKLMGSNAHHNFDYLDENRDGRLDALSNITYTINDKTIQFAYTSSEQKQECEDVRDFGRLYMKSSSWYIGNISYNCKFDADTKWQLNIDTITITDINKQEEGKFWLDNNYGEGTTTYNYAKGEVHIVGKYKNQTINCYEYYHPIVPITINQNESDILENVMENWGEGPCDPNFIRSTCPAWYYESLGDCTIDGQQNSNADTSTAKSIDAQVKIYWNVHEDNGKVDKIYTENIFRK